MDIRLPDQHGFSPYFPDKMRSTGPLSYSRPAGWFYRLSEFVFSITYFMSRTVELSRRSLARALPFCKERDMRDGRL